MTTVTYALKPVGQIAKHSLLPGARSADVTATAGGFFLVGETDAALQGRFYDLRAHAASAPFPLSTGAEDYAGSDSAVLPGGNIVTAYTAYDQSSHLAIFFTITGPTGATVKASSEIHHATKDQIDTSVAALSDGQFVVAWTYRFGFSDYDVYSQRYDIGGNPVGAVTTVDTGLDFADDPAVATLAGGGYVLAYVKAGDVRVVRYDTQYQQLSAIVTDATGTSNAAPAALALQDGGFAVAYYGNGWNTATSLGDITLQVFNADGSARSSRIRVNAADLHSDGGDTAGEQYNPTLTQLKSGAIVVGWETSQPKTFLDIKARAFDPQGHALTKIKTLAHSTDEEGYPSVAALADGKAVATWEKPGDGIFGGALDLVRTSAGTRHKDKIHGDAFTDRILGKGGADKLHGGAGGDILKGGKGPDKLFAGKDDERDIFVFGKNDSDAGNPDRVFQFDAHRKHETVWDKIDLSHIDGDRHHKHDQKLRFVDHFQTAGKHQPDGEVTVQDAGKSVKVLVDVNGDKDADMVIVVTHVHDLHRADFIL